MTARLKSELWVQALLRRSQVDGKNGAVLHRGHSDAGTVMVIINHLNGSHTLLGPAPGPSYDEEGTRRFILLTPEPLEWPAISAKIISARRFDTDLWVVEIEDRDGMAALSIVKD